MVFSRRLREITRRVKPGKLAKKKDPLLGILPNFGFFSPWPLTGGVVALRIRTFRPSAGGVIFEK